MDTRNSRAWRDAINVLVRRVGLSHEAATLYLLESLMQAQAALAQAASKKGAP